MAAYVIADIVVHDPETYKEYTQLVQPSLEPFGGRFVARGSSIETLEGSWQPQRLVVVEFPSRERALAWYQSEAYTAAKAIRQSASSGSLVLVEGVP